VNKYNIYFIRFLFIICFLGGSFYSQWLLDNRPRVLDIGSKYTVPFESNNHGDKHIAYISPLERISINLIFVVGAVSFIANIVVSVIEMTSERNKRSRSR
jgi:hypothetical protein